KRSKERVQPQPPVRRLSERQVLTGSPAKSVPANHQVNDGIHETYPRTLSARDCLPRARVSKFSLSSARLEDRSASLGSCERMEAEPFLQEVSGRCRSPNPRIRQSIRLLFARSALPDRPNAHRQR